MNKGFSLLEMLVVLSIFALLGILASQALILALRGTQKSTANLEVRENVAYAVSVIERQLHNAREVSPCPNPDQKRLDYQDERKQAASFSCQAIGSEGFVASGSARLTNEAVAITTCSFECVAGSGDNPPYVEINVGAKGLSTATKVFLRVY